MILHKIEMTNFRGFKQKTFCFKDRPVVLVSAANGLGKTTIVDAIEWCLTGSIGRLKNAFDTRSTNESDRKKNTDGILKNREAHESDKVVVTLWISNSGKETILRREQIKDGLDNNSKFTLNDSEELAKDFFREYIGDSFYNYHLCDVQKSFNVQSTKRKEMRELFGEFITNYDAQKMVATNLGIFAEDVDRYIDDKKAQKKEQEDIENIKEQANKAREDASIIPYPEIAFYKDERVDVTELNEDELNTQKTHIYNCGYQVVHEKLSLLEKNEALKQQKTILTKIADYWDKDGDSIRQALAEGLLSNTDAITALENKSKKLKGMSLAKETIFQVGEDIIALGRAGFCREDFDTDKSVIKEKQDRIDGLEKDIELLTKNNKMLKLLSSFSSNKQEVINYRDTLVKNKSIAKCPICGSVSFSTMDETLILKEADDYIKLNGESVALKQSDKNLLLDEIDEVYNRIIDRATEVVKKETEALDTKVIQLKGLSEKIRPYLSEVKTLNEKVGTVVAEELTAEKTKNLLKEVEDKIIDDSEEKKARGEYQQILSVIGYQYENETLKQTNAKIQNIIENPFVVTNFSYDIFVSKINAINSVLSNKRLLDLIKKQEEYETANNNIDKEITQLQQLKDTAVHRANEINEIIDQLSKDEYEKVGPELVKFYNKLARFNYHEGIRVIQENAEISLVDNKGKNIVNVLSNGQISIFMLAHFFAGINTRNDREKMKIYFIDDLTACMDDVNMLAFMDLLKYQMSTRKTMDQLFFVTCNDRISELFKYKMNGRGIELCELKESDFL